MLGAAQKLCMCIVFGAHCTARTTPRYTEVRQFGCDLPGRDARIALHSMVGGGAKMFKLILRMLVFLLYIGELTLFPELAIVVGCDGEREQTELDNTHALELLESYFSGVS